MSDNSQQHAHNSKRLQIEGLLHRGYATKDIVQIVKTTPGNVWKVKSILKGKSKLKPQELGPNPAGDTVLSAARPFSSHLVEPNATPIVFGTCKDPNSSQISKEANDQVRGGVDYSKLYSLFLQGERPIDIILNYNFPPSLVEEEYSRFQKLTDLQRRPEAMMLNILPMSQKSARIYEDYKKDGYIMLSKVEDLVNLKLAEENNTDPGHFPEWKLTKCKRCSRKDKVLANPRRKIGINTSPTVDIERCEACIELAYSHSFLKTSD